MEEIENNLDEGAIANSQNNQDNERLLSENIKGLLSQKDGIIEEKDLKIREIEKQIEAKEIERIIYSIYFSCGGIPDNDERNIGIKDKRFLPSKIIHNKIAPMVAKDKDGQMVILGENGEVEFNPTGDRKTIGDKIRELKDTESLKRFFLNYRDSNIPQSISPKSENQIDRELARKGKADIDAIASGRKIIRN